jgi:hypothetical protein
LTGYARCASRKRRGSLRPTYSPRNTRMVLESSLGLFFSQSLYPGCQCNTTSGSAFPRTLDL